MASDTWQDPFWQILFEAEQAAAAGAFIAAVAMVFVGIDAMGGASRSVRKEIQDGQDFEAWVERYMSSGSISDHQYIGKEMYAARCGLLHTYGATARYHRKFPTLREYEYISEDRSHFIDSNGKVLVVSIPKLIADFRFGLEQFLGNIQHDSDLKNLVIERSSMYICMKKHGPAEPIDGT